MNKENVSGLFYKILLAKNKISNFTPAKNDSLSTLGCEYSHYYSER